MDMSKLSESDLRAIASGDLRMMSAEGLRMIAGDAPAPAPAPTGTRQPGLREAGARLPTAGRAFINAAQGPLFGFADEIGAGGAALVDMATGRNPGMGFGDLYTRYRDVARGASESYSKERPVTSTLTQVAASLPLMGLYGAAERALPAAAGGLSVARNAAIVGSGSGAIGGAGNAETLADVPADAALGAAQGGVLSGAMSGAMSGARSVTRNVAARGSSKTAEDLARERVAAALTRDNRTAEQAALRAGKLGEEARIADLGGKNTRDLLDTMATMPGRTADRTESMIRNRQIGRPARIVEGAQGLAGGRVMASELADLTEQQARNARPLYEAVRNVPVAADGNLQRILQRPVLQDAIAQARVAAANADEAFPDIKAGEAVPIAVWDRIKRGLDDVIGLKKRGLDAGTANNAAKSTLADAVRTKQELLKYLDEAVPDYKRARDAFSGPAALKDAMEDGTALFSRTASDIRAALGGMSKSEQDAFRVGAMQALRERVGTESGQTSILKFWKEPATRERLQAVFPDARTFRQFEARLLAEGRLKLTEAAGRGSQTASRQSRLDDEGAAFLSAAAETGGALSAASPTGMLSAVRGMYGRTVMPETVRDQIGQMLLTSGPEAQSLLGDLSRYVTAEQARRAAAASRAGLLGGVSITSLLQ